MLLVLSRYGAYGKKKTRLYRKGVIDLAQRYKKEEIIDDFRKEISARRLVLVTTAGIGISAKETSADCVTAGTFNCSYASKRILRSQY